MDNLRNDIEQITYEQRKYRRFEIVASIKNFRNKMIKGLSSHLGLSLIFAFVIALILFLLSLTSIGWHFFSFIYLLILLGQIVYYRLTTYTNIRLTILSFITNFIFWVIELVKFDTLFHNSYPNDNYKIIPIVVGGLLWGLNKLTIDYIFKFLKMNFKSKNKLDEYKYF